MQTSFSTASPADRVLCPVLRERIMTADQAAGLIQSGMTLGMSGFTPAGAPKAVPQALARRIEAQNAAGGNFRISLWTGASTSPELDGALAKAEGIEFRLHALGRGQWNGRWCYRGRQSGGPRRRVFDFGGADLLGRWRRLVRGEGVSLAWSRVRRGSVGDVGPGRDGFDVPRAGGVTTIGFVMRGGHERYRLIHDLKPL